MTTRQALAVLACIPALATVACTRSGSSLTEANAAETTAAQQSAAATNPPPAPPTFTLAQGTTVPVRLQETLDTRRNRSGDRFTATLDEPLVSGDRVVLPKGTQFSGHIAESRPSGRFKGRGRLILALDSFEWNGQQYSVQVASAARWSGGHKKRNWLWIGGGAGSGAAIGAGAAGPPGALIGAGAGAAAGTVGALITGPRQVQLPIETRVTFRLQAAVQIVG